MFGICPMRDECYLVFCANCEQYIKSQAMTKHYRKYHVMFYHKLEFSFFLLAVLKASNHFYGIFQLVVRKATCTYIVIYKSHKFKKNAVSNKTIKVALQTSCVFSECCSSLPNFHTCKNMETLQLK